MIPAVLVAGMLTLCLVTTKPLVNQAFAVRFKCPDTRLTISVNPSSGSMVRAGEIVELSGNLSCGLNHAGVGGATIHLGGSYIGATSTDSSGNYHATAPTYELKGKGPGIIYKFWAKYDGDSGNIHGEPATAEISAHYTEK